MVAFAHQVEGVLDRLREGQLPLDDGLSTLLLQCNDMLRKLVAAVPTEGAPEDVRRRTQLLSELVTLSGRDLAATSHTDQTDGHRHEPATTSAGYQIAARFGPDTFRHGMDPLAIMSYLASLGQLETITCAQDSIGTLENLDPESCHFALSFTLMTQAEQPRIDAAFDFVRDDMSLEIQSLLDQPSCSAAPPPPPTPAAQTSAAAREQAKPAMDDGGYIRVMAHRLDEVINLLGELVIAGAGASMLARQTRQRTLVEANQQVTRLIEGIRNAGAIFVGRHTPEVIGDYVGGSNHVLPTARSARFSSGLGVLDYVKRTSILRLGPEQLRKLAPAAIALAKSEGLEAHARSVAIRLNLGD